MPPKRALVVACCGFAVGVIAQYLFVRERAGVNVGLAAFAVLTLGWLVRGERARPAAWALASGALALAFAALVAVRTDVAVVWFDILAALVLGGAFLLIASGASPWLPLLGVLRRCIAFGTTTLVGALPTWDATLSAADGVVRRASPFRGYAAGVVLAVPFVVLFSALFASADAVFERSLRDLLELEWLRDLLRDLPARAVVAIVVTWSATGAYAHIAMAPDRVSGPERQEHLPRLLSADPLLVALVLIDALFAMFVAVQGAYLFGGRDTLDAAGVTYSAYGRRGFFELVAVSAIVGAILFVSDVLVRAHRRSYVVAALALLALTGAILASAAYRMTLYQLAYGWTELRFYTFAGMAFIAGALAIFAWAIVARRMEYVLAPLVAAAAAVALVVNVIGPSGFVARRNLERVIEPAALPADASRDLDVAYLISLGDGALPVLVELASELPAPERSAVVEAVRVATLRHPGSFGWQSWNLDRERAAGIVVRATGTGAFAR